MKKRIKKTGKRVLLLLLVMLLAVPALPVLAADAPAVASLLEGMDAPEEYAFPQPEEEADPGEEPPQEDIPEDNTPVDALPLLVTGGHDTYLSGYDGALFKPDNNMMRGEVAYMMYNLLAAKPPVSQSQFPDVGFDSWWGPAINSVAAAGAFKGKGDGTFAPSASITRAEFVTALSNCFGLESGSVDFPDVEEDHWAYPYIASAVQKGWLDGYPDGTFGPEDPITRCQAVKIMNSALGRRDDDFAKDRAEQKFYDVPSSHWAYLEIAEAAKPVTPMDPDPPGPSDPEDDTHPIKKGDTVRVTADDGLNVRETPSTSGKKITTVARGTLLTVTDTSEWPWVRIKLSSGTLGYVHSDYIEKNTGSSSGNGNTSTTHNPVSNGGLTLSSGNFSLHQYQTFRLDASSTFGTSGMVWTSSNPDVATVGYTVPYNGSEQGAMVYGKSPGTATLTFSNQSGTVSVSSTVTVLAGEPVRFAYSDTTPVAPGTSFNLVAITGIDRSAVRFEIADGPATGKYTSTEFESKTATSQMGLPDNNVRIFRAAVSFASVGDYTVRAYSADASGNYSSDYKEFVVQVSNESPTTMSNATRRMSSEGYKLIANLEGFRQEIEDDTLATKNPTVGHGCVMYPNTTFYNNLTREESYGLLIWRTETGGFDKAVNNFRSKNGIRMSQANFDGLMGFTLNLGPAMLDADKYYTFAIMLNAVVPPSDMATNPRTGFLNVGSAPIYAAADLYSEIYATVPNGATVTVSGYTRTSNSTKQEVWYKVSYNGTSGWMPAGYVRLNLSNPVRDLSYADSTVLAYNFLQWHTASGTHYVGLLRRRLSELKVFFFANYLDGYNTSPNYTKNIYGFKFPTCCT